LINDDDDDVVMSNMGGNGLAAGGMGPFPYPPNFPFGPGLPPMGKHIITYRFFFDKKYYTCFQYM